VTTTAHEPLLEELAELLAIPSMSADEAHAGDVQRAAEWVATFIRGAGGDAEVVDWQGSPLAVGELRASTGAESAPTVLVYGHFDVQPPDPLELWQSEPFELDIRDGWLYARGIADDKGQLYLLLKAAAGLAAEGALPVNVRFACDGEEEVGGHSIIDFLADEGRSADAAVIFDADMPARGVPAFYVATRGIVYMHLRVRANERDLHSGMYGGAALNGMHALIRTLSGVMPRDGRLPEPLRAGIVPPTAEELGGWRSLTPGAEVLADQGARPVDSAAGDEFYIRTWAEPSLDVNGVAGGSPFLQKTVIPAIGEANLSMRLVADQDPEAMFAAVQRLLEESAPAGAEVELERMASTRAGLVDPASPAIRLAQDAFERALGTRPLLLRSGGSLPIVPALGDRGIPTVITGFALPESNVHSPNERLLLEYVPLGLAAARELFVGFGALPT
jgi:acetylornithine deacetylase/succinyl-diaminopimelate desuccinylase-like protein